MYFQRLSHNHRFNSPNAYPVMTWFISYCFFHSNNLFTFRKNNLWVQHFTLQKTTTFIYKLSTINLSKKITQLHVCLPYQSFEKKCQNTTFSMVVKYPFLSIFSQGIIFLKLTPSPKMERFNVSLRVA